MEPTTPSFSVNRMSTSHLSIQTEQRATRSVVIKPDKIKYEKNGILGEDKISNKHV